VIALAGWREVAAAAYSLGTAGWALILGCSLANYLLRFVRWEYYLRVLGHHPPRITHLLYYLAGFALTTTPAKAGETVRAFYLRPHGVRFSESLAAFFTERLLDVAVITLLALLAAAMFADLRLLVIVMLAVLLGALALVGTPWLSRLLSYGAQRSARYRVLRSLAHAATLLDAARRLLAVRRLALGLALGSIAWLIQGLAFQFILRTLNVELPLDAAIAIYAVSLLAGAVSFIPGGIGSTEAVMALLLLASGADNAACIAAPLISRIATLWFAVGVGLLATARLSTRGVRVFAP
jgi:uncharacterized protein (TIRG00374 family)